MAIIPLESSGENQESLFRLTKRLLASPKLNETEFKRLLHLFPKANGYFKKSEIWHALNDHLRQNGSKVPSVAIQRLLRVKPVRTLSGVTPVTVLTKPYPCPGSCIFCPSDIKMPKSYLSNEPGAQRAGNHGFDPYLQVYNRLNSFVAMGHAYDKVELLVLGGTWSAYPLGYRIWFIKRLFDALNDFGSGKALASTGEKRLSIVPKLVKNYNRSLDKSYLVNQSTATWTELTLVQKVNETARIRCVGLVLETRPDYVTRREVESLRRLGATKIQLGIQSLQDQVLTKNKRGHSVAEAVSAIALLRQAGFKLHFHWMPNLYGSTPILDKADYARIFTDMRFKPDEIKIYPCSLIEGTELMQKFKRGLWKPYSHTELLAVVGYALLNTPEYCRVTRVVRDIPSNDIVTGNKFTNLRQMVEKYLKDSGRKLTEIRSREIKNQLFNLKKLVFKDTVYETTVSLEHFLEYVTDNNQIVAFLRLSLPKPKQIPVIGELSNTAVIREVHVYGQALQLGSKKTGIAQHSGLGKKLIIQARGIALRAGFKQVSVISAIGTREYYRKIGFTDGDLYQHYEL